MSLNIDGLKKEIPYKWRVQSFSKYKPQATCVAYIDARDVMCLLDDSVGADNWQDDYKVVDGKVMAGIGIRCAEGWVWKWDVGVESNTDAEKGQISDAFKRAAVKWGVGRFLYSLKIRYVSANEKKAQGKYPYCVDDNGNRIYDLTEYFSKGGKSAPKKQEQPPSDMYLSLKDKLDESKDKKEMEAWAADNKQEISQLPTREQNELRDHYRGMEKVLK